MFILEQLWSSIGWRAAEGIQCAILCRQSTKPKIANFYKIRTSNEHVLCFEIAMNDVIIMLQKIGKEKYFKNIIGNIATKLNVNYSTLLCLS